MSQEVKVKTGTKIQPEEEKKLDRNKMGVMIGAGQTEGEVEAQSYYCLTQCPWCGHVGRSVCSSTVYLYYTCGWCGRPFRA